MRTEKEIKKMINQIEKELKNNETLKLLNFSSFNLQCKIECLKWVLGK